MIRHHPEKPQLRGTLQHMAKFFKKQLSWIRFIWPILFVVVGTVMVILYGRGYRPNLKQNTLISTGLLSATSDPEGAQVYVDGKLKTATKDTLNLEPGWYTVKIVKEGFIPWEKKLRLQGEIVTQTDAFLFPTNPSLSPVTNTGVINSVLSFDGTKIAYVIPDQSQQNNGVLANKVGLWVYDLTDKTLGLNRYPKQLGASTPVFDFSSAYLTWSPDSNQIMVNFGHTVRLYNLTRMSDFQDITLTYKTVLQEWNQERQNSQLQKLAAFKQPIVDMATSSAQIISFSPDETKILYEATASASIPQVIEPPLIGTNSTEETRNITSGKLYVYDSREDKNYFILEKSELPKNIASPSPSMLPQTVKQSLSDSIPQTADHELLTNLHWFPTNRHLVLTFSGKIDIMEYDRTNWITVYQGPLVEGFMAPWPNASRIIILTNLNPQVSQLPNLYTVSLR